MPIYARGDGIISRTFTNFPAIISDNINQNTLSWSIKGNNRQISTPTPNAPIIPEFVGVRTGNLFDTEGETNGKYLTSSGGEGSAAAYSYTAYIPVIGGEKYTISKTSTQNSSACHCWYDADKQFISSNTISQTTVTHTAPTSAAFLRCSYRKETVPEVMLNSGLTPLPYEPYGYKIPLTNAGQTASIYLGQTPTVRRIKKRVFDGSENWTLWVYQTAVMFYTPVTDGTELLIVSSHFGTRKTGSMPLTGNVAYNGNSNKNMLFRMLDDTTITTVEGFKAWLTNQYNAGTPVTVWYILATPETTTINEPLCKIDTYSDELIRTADTQNLILSTDTTNTISFDTQLLPSEFNIQYYGRKYHKITKIPIGNGNEIKFVVDKDGNYIFRKSE